MPGIESSSSRAQSRIGTARPRATASRPGSRPRRATVDVVVVERVLLGVVDRRAVVHQAQRHERLEEAQLVLVDADRIEGADIERAHLDVLHAGAAQRLGRAARPSAPRAWGG